MTYQSNCTLSKEILEKIAEEGLDSLPELIRVLINEAMRLEREQYLGARHYERSPERQGYANGYKPKMVKTRMGEVQFQIPQVRQGNFYPDALEKGFGEFKDTRAPIRGNTFRHRPIEDPSGAVHGRQRSHLIDLT